MKFFKPQVQLARQSILDAPDAYFLHIVTFCPRTCFRADGYSVSSANLAQGIYNVQINLLQDASLPDFGYITPVVHTLNLGSIAFPGGEGLIEVQVQGVMHSEPGIDRDPTTPPTTKTGGTGTVSTSDADSNPRPIPNDFL
jgi:hypothetical protein